MEDTTQNGEPITATVTIAIEKGIITDLVVDGSPMTYENVVAALRQSSQLYENKVIQEALNSVE